MLSSTLLHVHVYVHVVAFTTEASRRRSAIHSNLVIPYNLQYTSVLAIVAFRATVRRMTNYNIDIVSDTVCPW